MIKAFHVRNFKGFSELDVSHLAPVTLIAGMNSVGKTALLEAMFLFLSRWNPMMFFQQLRFRGLNANPMNGANLWKPLFYGFDMQHDIILNMVRSDIREEERLLLSYDPRYARNLVKESKGREETERFERLESSNVPRPAEAMRLLYTRALSQKEYYLILGQDGMSVNIPRDEWESEQTAIFLAARHILNLADDAARFSEFDKKNQKQLIIDALRVVDARVSDLSVVVDEGQAEGTIYADIGLSQKIPVRLMGDGICRLLSILLTLGNARDGVVFVDEIENGIHHSVLKAFWKTLMHAAEKFSCQLIATTHSYECVASAFRAASEENRLDDFAYSRLARSKKQEDVIVAKKFDADMLDIAVNANMEIR